MVPFIHPQPHVEQGEGKREVERGLDISNISWGRIGWPCAHKDAIKYYDEDFEDEDIQSHAAVIIRIITQLSDYDQYVIH